MTHPDLHPTADLEAPVEASVTVPPEAVDYAEERYTRRYGSPEPQPEHIERFLQDAIAFQFETADGADAVEKIVEACSWTPDQVVCPECGQEWSGKSSAVPDGVDGFQLAEKIADHWICLSCTEIFPRGGR